MAQKQYSVRLFIDADLINDSGVVLDRAQAHYVSTVMRKQVGETLVLFNGRDGEWLGHLQEIKKNHALVHITELLRPQVEEADIQLFFAPVKKIQTSLIIQKATELGVKEIIPVQTIRTNADRMKAEKLQLQAIEAAEQSERLTVPIIQEIQKLDQVLKNLEDDRALVFCHERYDGKDAVSVLGSVKGITKWAVLVGPEGGFTDEERKRIMSCDQAHTLSLGPRILRAETAVIAALTLLQALQGDWRSAIN
ncbi:MAG: 16S rRNA (uracil(1498)-N(3))-methyltransferase [Sneathiella sp.]|nr:16S rRNA (uracil(1498)-N(3))-methyltransferase [Sneathiella sp.]